MEDTELIKVFRRLSQGAKQSVQSGQELDDFDEYMHVDRPIDKAIRESMDNIRSEGGGILFLVGSAGDGKSHIISTVKNDYLDFDFRNDASESPWPTVDSIDALKIFLADFKDSTLHTTNSKMLVAINLGKLSAFIDDEEVQADFKEVVKCARTLFDDDKIHTDETDRVRIVSFANYQIFELYPELNGTNEQVDSIFIKTVLEKITSEASDNIFRSAFNKSLPMGNDFDPCYINYQLLCIPEIKESIARIIIEAIIRYKLMVTPRELFDFIYRIIVPDSYATFKTNKDFFKSLLPTLLFTGGENKIQKCLARLDPLKQGSIDHNDYLSELFTSTEIPPEISDKLRDKLHRRFFELLSEYYKNNRNNVEDISKLLFRIKHLLWYRPEPDKYATFLNILCGYYANDEDRLYPLYETIQRCIPRFYGSFTDNPNLVPIDIQGSEYKMFVSCDNLKPEPQNNIPYSPDNRNKFIVEIDTHWRVNTQHITLKIGYQLYEYLCELQKGKLAQNDDRNHNLSFSEFIRKLVRETSFEDKIIILTSDNQQLTLSRTFGKKATLK